MEKPTFKPYRLPSGGWGSALSVGNILRREGVEWVIGYPVNHVLEHAALPVLMNR